MRRTAAALLTLLLLPGAAKDPLAGRIAGAPVRCVSDFANSGPVIADQQTIIFNPGGRRLWVTHPQGACPALRPPATLIVEKWGSENCKDDRFRVLEFGARIPSAYCRFGAFVPYDKPDTRPPR